MRAPHVPWVYFLIVKVFISFFQVAITVYWLGKTAKNQYHGPHLDLSAFTGLVKSQGSIFDYSPKSPHHYKQSSVDSYEHSSAYSSFRSEETTPTRSTQENNINTYHPLEPRSNFQDTNTAQYPGESYLQETSTHNRDNSYDSLGSYSERQYSDENSVDNMPVQQGNMLRYGSTGNVNKTYNTRYSVTHDSTYTDEPRSQGKGLYQSNPDLTKTYTFGEVPRDKDSYTRFRSGSHHDISHTRYSSTDSLEYSHSHGNHSRQSSDSDGVYKPLGGRRTSSSQPPRDPLQFIKTGTGTLTREAEEQIQIVKETKKVKAAIEHEEADWQSVGDEDWRAVGDTFYTLYLF